MGHSGGDMLKPIQRIGETGPNLRGGGITVEGDRGREDREPGDVLSISGVTQRELESIGWEFPFFS